MSTHNCKVCSYFFPIPEDADDYATGKGDCVTEKEDEKGKFWLSKPVYETSECCSSYKAR
uniref:4-isopropylbenzyl-succinate synthase gamma subunit n=1 Tax=Thauera sp. pCyN2 TaxID=1551544 RepID=A0A096ZNX6_9RHOO|nr:4-isopropylbenzyl-succinate synthase gamma subunit [Thauera sp. pCyN2]